MRDIRCKLVLMTNKKSHMSLQLTPKWVTLSDLERRNRPFTEFSSCWGQLRQSGWRQTYTPCNKNVALRIWFLASLHLYVGVRHGPPGRQSYCPEPPSLEDHCKARRYAPVVEHATPTTTTTSTCIWQYSRRLPRTSALLSLRSRAVDHS